MATRRELTREAFDHMAEVVGLDPKDPRMDQLFPEVRTMFKVLERLDGLDVAGEEPALTFRAGPEQQP